MILQPVTNIEYCGASRYTGYIDKSVRMTLACGHELYRKASQKVPERARCVVCERDSAKHTEGERS
jgi:hypothetical protein